MKESEIIEVSDSQTTQVLENDSITKEKASGLGVRSVFGVRSARAGEELGSAHGGGWMGSTKLERLEMELQKMKRDRASAKAVVFSQVSVSIESKYLLQNTIYKFCRVLLQSVKLTGPMEDCEAVWFLFLDV